jgi:hypothetical protein
VTQAALREALNPISSKPGSTHDSDAKLGILYTSSAELENDKPDPDKPLGSIAVVLGAAGRREIWRFGDAPDKTIDLHGGRRMKAVGPPETAHAAAEA